MFVNIFAFFASLDLERRLVTKEGELWAITQPFGSETRYFLKHLFDWEMKYLLQPFGSEIKHFIQPFDWDIKYFYNHLAGR